MKMSDDQKMLIVMDSGTHVCIISQNMISACNFHVHHQSDVILMNTDDIFTDPIGVYDDFRFKLGNIIYITKIYVICKALFQFLLNNKFL